MAENGAKVSFNMPKAVLHKYASSNILAPCDLYDDGAHSISNKMGRILLTSDGVMVPTTRHDKVDWLRTSFLLATCPSDAHIGLG